MSPSVFALHVAHRAIRLDVVKPEAAQLTLTSTAFAGDGNANAELLCLNALDVRQTRVVVSEIAPRARVHADEQTNCFIIVAHPDKYQEVTRIIARLEARAQSRRAVAAAP